MGSVVGDLDGTLVVGDGFVGVRVVEEGLFVVVEGCESICFSLESLRKCNMQLKGNQH